MSERGEASDWGPEAVTAPRIVKPGSPAQASAPPGSVDLEDEREDELSDNGPPTARRTDFSGPPSPIDQRDRFLLLRMDGLQAGQVTSLGDQTCSFGRHPSNDVVIDDAGVSRRHARVVREGGVHFLQDLRSRNGTYLKGERIEYSPLRDGDWIQLGARVGFRYILSDEQQEKVLRQLYESSTRDALTGAYNRQHFDERLRSELAYASRHETIASLVLFDIDHFKQVNDSFGHQCGDAVLKQVTAAVIRTLRAEDVLARFGGEEFAVILRGIDIRGAARAAERIRAVVAASPALYEGRCIPLSISAGCASLTCASEPVPKALIGVADRRLYAAKRGGRDRVVAEG
ncbi:MAG TPA: GGDEF domain-containing protein [Polyangiaceae bacterium]|nr:GGDEF domain-containing protein [Polyangiaceae bacterium]